MYVYEVYIYINALTHETNQFLAKNWDEATKKAQVLLKAAKDSSNKPERVELERLEKLYELSEV